MFITVADGDKPAAFGIATQLHDARLRGHRDARDRARPSTGWASRRRRSTSSREGSPHVVDWIERGDVDLVINTPVGHGARTDGYEIRAAAVARRIPCITTMAGGMAAVRAIAAAAVTASPGRLAAGDLRRGGRGAVSADRVLAPFGRRRVEVSDRTEFGPYVVVACADPDGPRPRAGQFYMLAAASAGAGGDRERPFLPRAFSVMRAPAGGDRLEFLLHVVGPRHRTAVRARRGRGPAAARARSGSRSRRRGEGRRPMLVGGGVGLAPLAILADELRARPAGRPRHAARLS